MANFKLDINVKGVDGLAEAIQSLANALEGMGSNNPRPAARTEVDANVEEAEIVADQTDEIAEAKAKKEAEAKAKKEADAKKKAEAKAKKEAEAKAKKEAEEKAKAEAEAAESEEPGISFLDFKNKILTFAAKSEENKNMAAEWRSKQGYEKLSAMQPDWPSKWEELNNSWDQAVNGSDEDEEL